MFEGVHTALVTPFRNQQLDEPALIRLIEAQIAAGVAVRHDEPGLVALTDLGETAETARA